MDVGWPFVAHHAFGGVAAHARYPVEQQEGITTNAACSCPSATPQTFLAVLLRADRGTLMLPYLRPIHGHD